MKYRLPSTNVRESNHEHVPTEEENRNEGLETNRLVETPEKVFLDVSSQPWWLEVR